MAPLSNTIKTHHINVFSNTQKNTHPAMGEKKQHFILVHGACHGAWCWYKLKPLLEGSGHRVTVLDMAASGIDRTPLEEVRTLAEYSKPLLERMDGICEGEKVILVGHSLGGLSLAVAMEAQPEKIAAAVFLAAYVPDTVHPPSYVLDMHSEKNHIKDLLDVQFCSNESTKDPFTSMLFGPKFLSSHLYQLSPIEDLELAKTLVRPTSSTFRQNLSKAKKFSKDKFGKVAKVYVICKEDNVIRKEYQEWIIENSGIQNVMQIEGADHMAMFSKPQQLSQCLLHIAKTYV